MHDHHRDLIHSGFSLIVILLAASIAYRFFLPLAWGGIIAIVSWPLYERCLTLFRGQQTLASLFLTTILTLTVALPLLWVMRILIIEIHTFTHFVLTANREGIPPPLWLDNLPGVNQALHTWWDTTLGKPKGVALAFTNEAHRSLLYLSNFARKLGVQLIHRTIVFGFTLLCLFFFYRDGKTLSHQINMIGQYCLGEVRWSLYATQLPSTIKATVNGIVLVGLGVGILMGVTFAFLHFPAPALLGALTAILAMIPFGAPILFGIIAVIMLAQGNLFGAIILLAIGGTILFIADHFIRPILIQGGTRLPFLAVLFGILGGVEWMGLIGLFLGPAAMILFVTLWHEPELFERIRS